MWHAGHVTALLDFEWARPSWIECDLETLLAVADTPALFVAADYEHTVVRADYADLPRWLRTAYPRWFAHPRLADRLAILFVSRTLGCVADEPIAAATRLPELRVLIDSTP